MSNTLGRAIGITLFGLVGGATLFFATAAYGYRRGTYPEVEWRLDPLIFQLNEATGGFINLMRSFDRRGMC